MKPTPIHYIFARNWPLKGYLAIWAILGVAKVLAECELSLAALCDWKYCLLLVVSLLIASAVSMLLSLPVAFFVLGPLYYLGRRLAGAPFQVGDKVRVLVGVHRDRVAEVYAVWESRYQVRVWLGADAERDFSDVFQMTQVCRENGP